jgi:hypothetical protein
MTSPPRTVAAVLLLALLLGTAPAWAQTAKVRYEGAFDREAAVRTLLDRTGEPTAAERSDVLRQVSRVVASYEGVVRRYPTTGYADNALWQGGALAEAAYRRFGRADDRGMAQRLYRWLIAEYPASPLVRRAKTQVTGLQNAQSVEASVPATSASTVAPEKAALEKPARGGKPAPDKSAPSAPVLSRADTPAPPQPAAAIEPTVVSLPISGIGAAGDGSTTTLGSAPRATLGDIQRAVLPGTVRVTLELDREVTYR